MGWFDRPEIIKAEVFARVPDSLRKRGAPSSWIAANHPGALLDCFLEGPAFDRDGNLYMVDIPYGRILRLSASGDWDVAAEYDGWPNGLAIHRDGRVFIADYRHGIMTLDPRTGKVEPHLTHVSSESFRGVNDLVFARNGDLYFTDQGQTGIHDPSGRVYRLAADGRLDCLIQNGPSPNGIALDPEEQVVLVAMTRANCMWHLPLKSNGGVAKCGVFAYLPGIHGPDGLAMDDRGNLLAAHARIGIVWLLSPLGQVLAQIESAAPGPSRLTNCAYGGPDRRSLYICESYSGQILRARMDVPGLQLYSHT
jgi:gluconolactonase